VAVNDSWKNFEYLKKIYDLRFTIYDFKLSDARKLSEVVADNSIDAIATEPYLGPQRGERNFIKI